MLLSEAFKNEFLSFLNSYIFGFKNMATLAFV